MRTKALLGLAVLAASAATCLAQNVYSLNIVGYVNVTVPKGAYSLVANPLVPNGQNYSISNIMTLTDNDVDTLVYKLGSGGYTICTWYGTEAGWDPLVDLNLGEAFFVKPAQDLTLTFVGEVKTGTITGTIPAGASLQANSVPVTEPWPGKNVGNVDDTIFTWGGSTWANNIWTYYGTTDGWLDNAGVQPEGPTLAPGSGVAYVNKGAPINWTRTFTVN